MIFFEDQTIKDFKKNETTQFPACKVADLDVVISPVIYDERE